MAVWGRLAVDGQVGRDKTGNDLRGSDGQRGIPIRAGRPVLPRPSRKEMVRVFTVRWRDPEP